jgi:hypothetical protein
VLESPPKSGKYFYNPEDRRELESLNLRATSTDQRGRCFGWNTTISTSASECRRSGETPTDLGPWRTPDGRPGADGVWHLG